jgi:hypothetical protein
MRLARAIDEREKYDSSNMDKLEKFQVVRGHLSRFAWESYAAAIGCDHGEIAKAGVVWRRMDDAVASRFLSILEQSPNALLRRDDFAFGYMSTISAPALEYNRRARRRRGCGVLARGRRPTHRRLTWRPSRPALQVDGRRA